MRVCRTARRYERLRPFRHKGTSVRPLTRAGRVGFVTLVLIQAAGSSLWSGAVGAQATGVRSLLRQLYGDLAVEVRTGAPGTLTLGAADARLSLAINLMATDVRRWADSAARMLAARPPRRGQSVKWEAVVSGPGIAAGSMSLARQIAPGDTSLILLVTDTSFQGVRTAVSMIEARAFVGALKRAADASLRPPAPPAQSSVPAAKRPPRPPGLPKR